MGLFFSQLSQTTIVLLSLSIILLSGFLFTRVTKLAKLPHVTGYILSGIVIGPYMLGLVSMEMVEAMGFVSDIALAFIAFSVGSFFTKDAFRDTGSGVIVITLMESLLAGVLVTLSMVYILKLNWDLSLMLGAIATATAPASTVVTIRQYRANGQFVNTLLQVVAFDDVICLIVFSLVAAIINAKTKMDFSVLKVMLPILYNLAALVFGAICGVLLSRLVTLRRSEENQLILAIAFLLGLTGVCSAIDVSPLLACMVFSMTYKNITRDKKLYKLMDGFTPPILLMFFVVSGMNLDITAFGSLGIIGAGYFIIRIIGKYLGAYLGAVLTKSPKNIRHYLGFALIPQAGVSIGLAFLGERILPPDLGSMLLTIILASAVLYELVGPISAKMALIYSGSIDLNYKHKK